MAESSTKKKNRRRKEWANRSKDLPPIPENLVLKSQRRWDIAKLLLRVLSMVFCLTQIGELIAITINNYYIYTGWEYDYASSYLIPGYVVNGSVLVWDIAELIVISVRRDISDGITPKAHVGVELSLWSACIVGIALQATFNLWWYEIFNGGIAIHATQLGFFGAVLVLRFILFVRACIETDRRNKDKRAMKIVLELQRHGQDPRDFPLTIFKSAQYSDPARFREALSSSNYGKRPLTDETTLAEENHPAQNQASPPSGGLAPDERDFAMKYSNMPATAYELLEMGIHPEDARNQKVLIGAAPRTTKILNRRSF
ncbi:hypothetical protein F5Y16DRAFT_167605 [Xylariaceae sp. FL0255]|nr:hypothetical protein F5Y16DRAFT_167605 [Xylariaceae sp. FL0255]